MSEMGIFIPKTHAKGEIQRWCKVCCKGPARGRDYVKVRQGPMDFWFCSEACAFFWGQKRYDPKYAKYFKMTATERLSGQCKTDEALPSSSNSVAGVCHLLDSSVSMQ